MSERKCRAMPCILPQGHEGKHTMSPAVEAADRLAEASRAVQQRLIDRDFCKGWEEPADSGMCCCDVCADRGDLDKALAEYREARK